MSKNKEWTHEQELAFWTAKPIRYGLPFLVAVALIVNVMVMKHFLFDGKAYDWGAASILLAMIVSTVFVSRKVERIKAAIKK